MAGMLIGCVQKSSKKTVVYILKISGGDSVETVGLRGKHNPLNWRSDYEMNKNSTDSTYEAVVTYITGYKFTEVKFSLNNQLEFQEQANRKVVFEDSDTTIFRATYNSRK